MDFAELYHRRYVQQAMRGQAAPRVPGGIPRSGDLHMVTFTAYLLHAGQLRATTIFEKPDQNFPAHATPFERQWSKLVSLKNPLNPVVDANLVVVGHLGDVGPRSILMPSGNPFATELTKDIPARLLAAEIPCFVGTAGGAWVPITTASGSGEGVAVTVMTGIDGRVVAALAMRPTSSGAIAEAITPLDVLLVTKGVVALGVHLGKKLVGGLARRTARDFSRGLFSGPTQELAQLGAAEASVVGRRVTSFIPESGMTARHFAAFQQAAKEANVIAVVRNTNPASARLIEQGCPGKPMFFKFNTSERTGIVMAETEADVATAWAREYFVVGADGVARREVMRAGKRVTETLDLKGAFWKVEKGQVIDPVFRKPVVGDYDLMGVIDPRAAGRNIALVARGGQRVEDVTSPIVKRFADTVNAKLDRPRVLHGAQDQFGGFRKGATAFHPDGTVEHLPTEAAVRQFYERLGRQTIKGSYRPAGTGA